LRRSLTRGQGVRLPIVLIVLLELLCEHSRVMREIPLTFAVVVGAIGLILIISSALQSRHAQATTHWPSVPGKVLRAEIRPVEAFREKKQKVLLYAADVAYRYTVDGKEHIAGTIRPDLQSQPTTAEAERLIELYPVGKNVAVYYNPANPADAVLEPGRNPQTISLLVCGIALTIVSGIMVAIRFLRRG
jgi:hypothetical protein